MRKIALLLIAAMVVVALGGLLAWRQSQVPLVMAYGSSVVDALSGGAGTEGYARALAPRPFAFPADAGPHPAFQTEWWYFTGNLEGADGSHYGYQLTFFRRALTPRPVKRKSDWAASDVYFAHFTVTDVSGGKFHSDERWARGAAGLAGARAAVGGAPLGSTAAPSTAAVPSPRPGGGVSFDAWVESWSARADGKGTRLRARSGDVSIDLRLDPERDAALQGDRGLSHKSVDPTNASYYYSVTRLATTGALTIGGRSVAVNGLSWLDREWSTSALSKDEVGWDWFSLQLSDGRDVMLYRMRRKDGSVDPQSSGSIITPGGVRPLKLSDFTVESTGTWKSPRSGATYPSGWRIRISSEHLDLVVDPWLADQELQVSFLYWEGAVRVRAVDGSVTGNGYVELTGYADRPDRER